MLKNYLKRIKIKIGGKIDLRRYKQKFLNKYFAEKIFVFVHTKRITNERGERCVNNAEKNV